MNIAILGGSFNPPHIGHALVANQLLELFPLDAIWLMPAYKHPFEKQMAPARDRLAMTRLLESRRIKTSVFEIERKGTNYTIDTLDALSKKYPQHTFYWIIGSDQLYEFKKWKNWKKLISSHNFIIFPRPKMEETIENLVKKTFGFKTIPSNLRIANSKLLVEAEISSTIIRSRIKAGKSIKYMVPDKIEEYIKKHKLYE